ncbi:MAG: cupin domain-containing protein, partial [Rhodospirillaceae bacterium]|nr:cupin domain-containing protein [Rhodospirillaceae bacterium]
LLAEKVAAAGRSEHDSHVRVYRPWGYYEGIDAAPGFQVKRIMVKPGERLSLQKHAHRSEHWIIVSGRARVTIDERIFELEANQSTYVPVGSIHRLENCEAEPLLMVEVQCGDYLGEDDIIRLEDNYHRS